MAENARELERLRSLVARLSDQQLATMVNQYWSVAGVLGHIVYWDGRAQSLAGKLARVEAREVLGKLDEQGPLNPLRAGHRGEHLDEIEAALASVG